MLFALLQLLSLVSAALLYNKRLDYEEHGLVKGVNLGGWFVIEPFITPSLFEPFGDNIPVDEYHYTQALGKEEAKNRLEAHWSSFIVEDDIKQIASLGLNFVRIPIGYWAFLALDEDPYVQGQVKYLDQALEWCKKYNIQAWIDLHAVPGSQNGFDNSGFREDAEYLAWNQGDNDNVEKTYKVIASIAAKYGQWNYLDVVAGIELVNEPLGTYLDIDKIQTFYEKSYKSIRDDYNSLSNVIVHDAFREQNYWDDKFHVPDFWGVVIDHHRYQMFSTDELARSIDEHVDHACQQGNLTKTESHWTVTGEWSAALTDCTKWLNGVGRGARYDMSYQSSQYFGSCEGINDISTWSDERKENTRKYIEAQLDAYEQGAGWVFWTWKTENALEWDFQKLVYEGLIPQPLNDRKYPHQCGY